MTFALAPSCYFVHRVLFLQVAWSCMDKKTRIKLTQDQRDAIDEYNTGVSPDKKVNKHYSAARAQWLNENIFEPSNVALVPVPPPQKLKKAQWDAQRSNQPTTSTHSMSRGLAYEVDDEDITFTVPRDTFADPIKHIIIQELKVGNKKLLKEVDARLEKFGEELSSSITKSIAAMLVSRQVITSSTISPSHNISLNVVYHCRRGRVMLSSFPAILQVQPLHLLVVLQPSSLLLPLHQVRVPRESPSSQARQMQRLLLANPWVLHHQVQQMWTLLDCA